MNKLLATLLSLAALFAVAVAQAAVDTSTGIEATLSEKEIDHLVYMREEEKLARDTYITLYDRWGSKVFTNISRAEQKHMDALLVMLNNYGLDDPVTDDTVGAFNNSTLAGLYADLVARGDISLLEALHVGGFIEEVDILDLQDAIADTDEPDLILTYENLMAGSFNHLRAFVGQIESLGVEYVAQVMEQSEVDEILGKPGSGPGENFTINAGLNDAWYYPGTDGQGFFITVFPDLELVFMAWFTFDTERPADDVEATLGDPGHRWMTAQGPYIGNQAQLDIDMSMGGIFDSGDPAPVHQPDGSIVLQFDNCRTGTVTYEIPSINQMGVVPIQRLVPDNVALCEELGGMPTE